MGVYADVWEVRTVGRLDADLLLLEGWEPISVTTREQYLAPAGTMTVEYWHLRRKTGVQVRVGDAP